jgi:signal peptidase II
MASDAEPRPFWALVAVTVVLDRITKMVAENALLDGPIRVIGDTVQLRLVYNRGAAFGLGQAMGPAARWVFLTIAVVAIVLLARMAREAQVTDRLRQYALGFVAGGAAGNLIDRLLSSAGVVDFIDVGIEGVYRWPTFNVADIAVTCGAVALFLSLWREDAGRRSASAT